MQPKDSPLLVHPTKELIAPTVEVSRPTLLLRKWHLCSRIRKISSKAKFYHKTLGPKVKKKESTSRKSMNHTIKKLMSKVNLSHFNRGKASERINQFKRRWSFLKLQGIFRRFFHRKAMHLLLKKEIHFLLIWNKMMLSLF